MRTTTTFSPIGMLIVDAEHKSKKKASKTHTSESTCGCQVTITWFSEASRSNKIERCTEHALDPNRKRR